MLHKSGVPLANLKDWEDRAGPKDPKNQWADGRSAKEAAKCWLGAMPHLPQRVQEALASHSEFGQVISWQAEPEVRLSLDGRRGEMRNTDLLVQLSDASGPFIVAVEAKADEPFDRTMSKVLVAALEAKIKAPGSGALNRATDLVTTLLPPREEGRADVGALRYQLFTAAVGVLRKAEELNVRRAVLLIQEFVTDKTQDHKHKSNSTDLNAWINRVSKGAFSSVANNTIVGPITINPSVLVAGTAQLYIGKCVDDLRKPK